VASGGTVHLIGARVVKQATTIPTPKAVTTTYPRASPNLPRTTPLTSNRRNTLINPTTVIYYNYNKDNYFALSCLELKDIGDIKEMEEGETSDKSRKEEP